MDVAHRSRSADVDISLHVNGDTYQVAQLGPDFLILRHRSKVSLDSCTARVTMRVDDAEDSWPVELTEGVCPESVRTPISTAGLH